MTPAGVDVETETTIARPVEVVAAYAADPSNAPEWYQNITSVRWRTSPPLEVGSEVEFVARFLGRTLTYTYRVHDYVQGERLVMETAEGPFPMRTSYRWRAAGPGSTHMTLRNTGAPAGFAGVAAPLMAAAMRRANRKDLARLQAVLEARP